MVTESEDAIGGDCTNVGCVPSKALLHAAKTVHTARTNKFAPNCDSPDAEKVFQHVRDSVQKIKDKETVVALEEEYGVTMVVGRGRFVSQKVVQVNDQKYTADKIVIATGSRPHVLDVPGVEKASLHTNETIFSIDTIPDKLLVIGAGPIGIELGQAFAMLGSKVTILDHGNTFLPKEDKDVAEVLKRECENLGMTFKFSASVVSFLSKNVLKVKNNTTKKTYELDFDAALVSIGREVSYKGLGLDIAGVELDERGLIKHNGRLRSTSNTSVYVSGDAAGPPFFTHMTELHAKIIVNNWLSPFKKKLSLDNFAWVTFTEPQVSTFGQSQKQLDEQDVQYNVLKKELGDTDRMITDDYQLGLLKVFLDKKGRVLGGSMVGKNAGEITQELSFLMAKKIKLKKLMDKVYPYPIESRINTQLAVQHVSKSVTPTTKRLLKILYKLFGS
jgi:pyruvate/2-oxoglutarate dehydrogenase complex dihydrolipoamide dehydrogenase (E3) component